MNLIEQLGGYERAKDGLHRLKLEKKDLLTCGDLVVVESEIDAALIEYRRQHKIFEVGDKVVFRECSGIGGASDAIDLMTVKSIDAFGVRMTNSLCPGAIQIRHATDEEIKAGKRLEVKSEN